jgi:hypothetical protein
MVKALTVLLLAGTVIAPKSCTIGSPPPGNGSSFTIGVPFFPQTPNHCGPASIEMWAAFDGVSVSQDQIAAYIGCPASSTASPDQIVEGVQHFTRTGRDASIGYNTGGEYYSAEVTSINSRVPVLCLLNGALHAGVIDGGEWHTDSTSGLYVWDTVYFNDPFVGPDQTYFAATWTGTDDVAHVISAGASAGAQSNFDSYGRRVLLHGSGVGGGGPLPY